MKKILSLLTLMFAALSASAGNVIYYTSSDGKVVRPDNPDAFGARIVSNTYVKGQGKIVFKGEVKTIGDGAFMSCHNLTSVKIPDSADGIGNSAFSGCERLTSVEIPNSVTEIFHYAFLDCSALTSVEIPDSITFIGSYAFSGCSKLKTFISRTPTPPNLNGISEFDDDVKQTCVLMVPVESEERYRKAEVWKEFLKIESVR